MTDEPTDHITIRIESATLDKLDVLAPYYKLPGKTGTPTIDELIADIIKHELAMLELDSYTEPSEFPDDVSDYIERSTEAKAKADRAKEVE